MRTDFIRHPRGFAQAKRNNAKSTKCPPTNYDDIPNNKSPQAYKYGMRLFQNVKNFTPFCLKFKKKFPSFSNDEIKEIFHFAEKQVSPKTINA